MKPNKRNKDRGREKERKGRAKKALRQVDDEGVKWRVIFFE